MNNQTKIHGQPSDTGQNPLTVKGIQMLIPAGVVDCDNHHADFHQAQLQVFLKH